MKSIRSCLFVAILLFPSTLLAGDIKGKLPNGSGYSILATGSNDSSSQSSFTLNTASNNKARLYLLKNNSLSGGGPVIAGVTQGGKFYSYNDALKQKICKKAGAKLVLGVKTTGNNDLNVGSVKTKSNYGIAYLGKLLAKKNLDLSTKTALSTTATDKAKCLPASTGASLGLEAPAGSTSIRRIHLRADSEDSDGDGLVDVLDIDSDGDGVLNNYDSESLEAGASSIFQLFSNLKLGIGQSLNEYVQTVTTSDIDSALNQASLAIQVAGGSEGGNTTELDCGSLNYCRSGGTGQVLGGSGGPQFPDDHDTDSDGFGTLTIGSTGDFQLSPHATSSQIAAGDTYIEIVTDSGSNETEYSGMLNFIFNTTPAVRSLTMTGSGGPVTTNISYPANSGMAGSENNPISAPAGWNQVLTIEAFRPQRPGISAAGEGAFVDVGNSLITIDIPNAPCSSGTSGGCGGNGPGNCSASAYSESDANLQSDPNGLKDTRGDQDTDTANPESNTVTFTIDLAACLSAQSITFSSGQKIALDLQFRDSVGDNAAQKFYVQIP